MEVERGGAACGDADGYEEADDGTDSGYCEADGERADHPFAVQGKFAAADMEEGVCEGEEEVEAEDDRGGRLGNASDGGHGEAHDEGGYSHDGGGDEVDAPRDPMPLRTPVAEAAVELKWAERDEEQGGENVDESEQWVAGEDVIGGCELGEGGISGCGGRVIAVEHDRNEVYRAAHDDGNANQAQKDCCGPEKLA